MRRLSRNFSWVAGSRRPKKRHQLCPHLPSKRKIETAACSVSSKCCSNDRMRPSRLLFAKSVSGTCCTLPSYTANPCKAEEPHAHASLCFSSILFLIPYRLHNRIEHPTSHGSPAAEAD